MQTTTSIKTLALISALSLFGGVAFAETQGAMEDAVTKSDEGAEAAMKDAEAVEETAVKKAEKLEKQGKEMTEEEVGGVDKL